MACFFCNVWDHLELIFDIVSYVFFLICLSRWHKDAGGMVRKLVWQVEVWRGHRKPRQDSD